MTTYTTRNEAITREIIEPLGEWANEHDIDAIADELIVCDATGPNAVYSVAEDADFWAVVAANTL